MIKVGDKVMLLKDYYREHDISVPHEVVEVCSVISGEVYGYEIYWDESSSHKSHLYFSSSIVQEIKIVKNTSLARKMYPNHIIDEDGWLICCP